MPHSVAKLPCVHNSRMSKIQNPWDLLVSCACFAVLKLQTAPCQATFQGKLTPYLLKFDLTACTWGRRDQNTTKPDRVKLFQHVLASWTQAQSSCTWSLRRRPKSRFTHRFCWPHTTSSVFPGLPRPSMNINEHHTYQKSGHPKWFNAASLILRQNDDHCFPLSIDSTSSRSLLLDEPSAPSSELYPAAPEQAVVQISSPTELPKCELHPFRRLPYDVHRCFPTVFQRLFRTKSWGPSLWILLRSSGLWSMS